MKTAIRHTTLLAALAALQAACAPAASSDDNDGCAHLLPGDLVVTEILADPSGSDTGHEYIEIFNATESEIDLAGVSLYVAGAREKSLALPTATVAAGAYFVLGDARDDVVPSYVDYAYGSKLGALPNESGRVGLRCRGTIIDEIAYAKTKSGHARELDGAAAPDAFRNDEAGAWCDAQTPIPESEDFGTPGEPNARCAGPAGAACEDPETGEMRAPVAPAPGELVITEVLPQPGAVSDANGEWFEVHATRDVELNGLTVKTASGATTIAAPTCLRVPGGGYAVLARNDDPETNGGLPAVLAKISVTLANANGVLALRSGDTIIDEIAWASSAKGVALQIDAAALAVSSDDGQPRRLCRAATTYGAGDLGTPGAPNSPCPMVVEPGQCLDPTTDLPRLAVRPAPGQLAISEVMPDPAAVPDAAGEWVELLASAAVDLNDLLVSTGSEGGAAITSTTCLHLEAGDYAILAHGEDAESNGGLPFVTARLAPTLPNTTGTLTIRDGSTTIDALTWTKAKPGVALQRDPGDRAAVCEATLAFGPSLTDRGTPGATNSACAAVAAGQGAGDTCLEGTTGELRNRRKPEPGDLVITEVMADPVAVADNLGEWFEIEATRDVDLAGLELGNEGNGRTVVGGESCLALAAGQRALFGHSADTAQNGGLPPVVATFSFGLGNAGTAASPRALVLKSGEVEIDRMTYVSSKPGVSLQLSRDQVDALANDDSAAWCFCATEDADDQPANQLGAGGCGTPAAENRSCP